MKVLWIALLALSSLPAIADEECEIKLGFENYFFQASDGALATADGSKFQLAYWKDNKKHVVQDAKITVLKTSLFHQEKVSGHNGMGSRWVNLVTDYATRLKVETSSTEIYPSMMGNPAVKELTVSTLCTSIVQAD